MNNSLDKILIVQTAFLGDVILATPIIEKLHQFYPEATLDFLLRKGNESLLQGHPHLRQVLILDKKNKYKSLWQQIKIIRKEKYDLVINVQRFATSGLITVFSGAKQTVGFNKNPLSLFFSKSITHYIDDKENDEHEVDRNIKLIGDITDFKIVRPKLYLSEHDYNKVSQFKTGKYICIAPTSVWFTKQFPKEKWIDLIKLIPDEYHIYLLGAPGDEEDCEKINSATGKKNITNLAGKLSLLESSALMKDAVLNYVNDSAPMHLATQINAPVCAVYCSTIPAFGFGPLSDFSRIVEVKESLSCRPCNLHGYKQCPQRHFKCALDIEVSQLLKVFKEAANRAS